MMENVQRFREEGFFRSGWLLVAAGVVLGLVMGVGLSTPRGGRLLAGGGDRPDASLLTSGPIATEWNRARSIQATKDAIYYLNYSKGRLLAAVPLQRQTASSTQMLSEFAERDLVADFQLPPGTRPHFTMTAAMTGAFDGEGWAPLYVFETTTGQMVIYRVVPQATPGSTRPAFQLLERRSDARLAHAGTTETTGKN